MGKPHPIELRERVVCMVAEGNSHRSTAAHFRVSVKFVNDMVRLKRETGSLLPKRQGNPGRGKLSGVKGRVRQRLQERGELTLDELVLELFEQHAIKVHRSSVGRLLHRLGLTHKKTLAGRRAKAR
ncbi:helix-turn-helix domain-containing protein [Flexibacterium corallicola]|uniref:helix-turn-helix domain-containing protein n=1 Tax=Flexibacterium corallicola TaxID=3037259 RepID=UPI0038620AF8